MSDPISRLPRRISIWTVVQVLCILAWIGGFAVAFYFVQTYTKPSQKSLAQNGQLAGMVLTGVAYLVIIFSMIKHSPDARGKRDA